MTGLNAYILRLCVVVLCCCAGLSATAQDVHFSQFYAMPTQLNPAKAGHMEGDWRLSNIYRRQWSAVRVPFVTLGAAFDAPFRLWGSSFGGAIQVLNDKSGMLGLEATAIHGSLAWHKEIGRNGFHLGAQVGYVARSFDANNLLFPDQYDPSTGTYISGAPTSGTGFSNQSSYLDVNVGLLYVRKFRWFEPEIGVGLFHVNQPNDSFFGETSEVGIRQNWHFGGKARLSRKMLLLPRVLYMQQSGASGTLIGSGVAYKVPTNNVRLRWLSMGAMWRDGFGRNADALIVTLGSQFRFLQVGLSYDASVSSLRNNLDRLGGWELSIVYTPKTRLDKVTLPCDRN